MLVEIKKYIIQSLALIIPTLIVVAYFTLAERKLMAAMQRRQGPNMTGYWGLLQPLMDGFKLILTEIIIPTRANFILFLVAPAMLMTISFSLFTLIPFSYSTVMVNSEFSLLLFFTLSSFNVYSIFIAGWASNSKYALLGAIRSVAQMLSYELVIGTSLLTILASVGSLNLMHIVYIQQATVWLIFPLYPTAAMFFVSMLAETNRIPFDLSEAESELVAGYNVEYSSITFSFFFLGEYCNIVAMSSVFVLVFLGGWDIPFNSYLKISCNPIIVLTVKVMFICCLFIIIRAGVPRYRFDQLMFIGWYIYLPLSFGFFIFVVSLLQVTGTMPITSYYFLFTPDQQ